MQVHFMNDQADSIVETNLTDEQVSVLRIVDSISVDGCSYTLVDIDFIVESKETRIWLKSL